MSDYELTMTTEQEDAALAVAEILCLTPKEADDLLAAGVVGYEEAGGFVTFPGDPDTCLIRGPGDRFPRRVIRPRGERP